METCDQRSGFDQILHYSSMDIIAYLKIDLVSYFFIFSIVLGHLCVIWLIICSRQISLSAWDKFDCNVVTSIYIIWTIEIDALKIFLILHSLDGSGALEKEESFVQKCMESLSAASSNLDTVS